MPAVHLGKIVLRWCDRCNLPILGEVCGSCGAATRGVHHTPPGDIRPAFAEELARVRALLDEKFGHGAGDALLPRNKVVVLNKVPHTDRMDEYIVDGYVLFTVRYDACKGFSVVLKKDGARRLALLFGNEWPKNWVCIDNGARNAVKIGYNVMSPGVLRCDTNIMIGDEVFVLHSGQLLGVGIAKMAGKDMMKLSRGLAVKMRFLCDSHGRVLEGGQTWNDVVNANRQIINEFVAKAMRFIERVTEKFRLPVIVSYSGGKDSLATLLLLRDYGLKPPILFIDTGLEFPETVRNVIEVAKRYGLKLMAVSAENAFWRALDTFGPPAKNYRWCCKTCKLGPTALTLHKYFPKGVLTFIGQRRYESEQRAKKGSVWQNPWVPNQVAASPIQEWTSMHVWLYIFMKNAPYNELYEKGLDRIGCYLCPAADMAEFEMHRYTEFENWMRYLEIYAAEMRRKSIVPKSDVHFGKNWARCGGWRIKSEPRGNRIRVLNAWEQGMFVYACLNAKIDLRGVENMLHTVSKPIEHKGDRLVLQNRAELSTNGLIKATRKDFKSVLNAVLRAMECVGCGVCVAYCPNNAIEIKNNKCHINTEVCKSCQECMKICTVLAFR